MSHQRPAWTALFDAHSSLRGERDNHLLFKMGTLRP